MKFLGVVLTILIYLIVWLVPCIPLLYFVATTEHTLALAQISMSIMSVSIAIHISNKFYNWFKSHIK